MTQDIKGKRIRKIHCSDGVVRTYDTLKTLHAECEEKLVGKCQWEHMTRFQVLREWSDTVCDDCKKNMSIQEVTRGR